MMIITVSCLRSFSLISHLFYPYLPHGLSVMVEPASLCSCSAEPCPALHQQCCHCGSTATGSFRCNGSALNTILHVLLIRDLAFVANSLPTLDSFLAQSRHTVYVQLSLHPVPISIKIEPLFSSPFSASTLSSKHASTRRSKGRIYIMTHASFPIALADREGEE